MPEIFKFLAGPARVLIFSGNNLIGVGKSATETTFSTSIAAEDIRAGQGNALRGRYFHDASLGVTITYADFDLTRFALTSGGSVVSGGTALAEESLVAGTGGVLFLTNTAVAIDGTILAWYRKPSESDWTVATVSGNQIIPSGALQNDTYCVKYFYVDENAKSVVLSADYVPAVVHLVLIADEFAGISSDDIAGANKYGKLIVDIPSYQLEGGQELSLSSGSAATMSLNGSALAISQDDSCDESLVFGTITEQINNASWLDDVLSIAPEDGEISLAKGESETIAMRVIFRGLMAAQRKANSNFNFAIETSPATTATGTTVSSVGVVTAGNTDGVAIVKVTLKNAPNVPAAYCRVEVESQS